MSAGLSYESFCAVIDVAQSNIYVWEKKHPEFQEAKRHAFAKSRLFFDNVAITALTDPDFTPNPTIYVFNMKNRFGWRDKKDMAISGEVKIDITGLIEQAYTDDEDEDESA